MVKHKAPEGTMTPKKKSLSDTSARHLDLSTMLRGMRNILVSFVNTSRPDTSVSRHGAVCISTPGWELVGGRGSSCPFTRRTNRLVSTSTTFPGGGGGGGAVGEKARKKREKENERNGKGRVREIYLVRTIVCESTYRKRCDMCCIESTNRYFTFDTSCASHVPKQASKRANKRTSDRRHETGSWKRGELKLYFFSN